MKCKYVFMFSQNNPTWKVLNLLVPDTNLAILMPGNVTENADCKVKHIFFQSLLSYWLIRKRHCWSDYAIQSSRISQQSQSCSWCPRLTWRPFKLWWYMAFLASVLSVNCDWSVYFSANEVSFYVHINLQRSCKRIKRIHHTAISK